MKSAKIKLSCLPAAIGLTIAAIAEADSSSDEEQTLQRATPRKLPKSRQYFHHIEQMDDAEFLSHFRLSKGELLQAGCCASRYILLISCLNCYSADA